MPVEVDVSRKFRQDDLIIQAAHASMFEIPVKQLPGSTCKEKFSTGTVFHGTAADSWEKFRG